MLLGSKIFLSTDALNLCYREQRSACILRWFLLLQEYDIDLRHIPGVTNKTSDALSCLPRLDDIDPFNEDHLVFPTREITYCAKLKDVPFPPGIDLLYKEQLKIDHLREVLNGKEDKNYERICISNTDIVVLKDTTRVVVPPVLQYQILDWYYCNLLHPGITRTYKTIKKHFFWLSLRRDVI